MCCGLVLKSLVCGLVLLFVLWADSVAAAFAVLAMAHERSRSLNVECEIIESPTLGAKLDKDELIQCQIGF